MKITTTNRWHNFLCGTQLTKKEKAKFVDMKDADIVHRRTCWLHSDRPTFIRYRRGVYSYIQFHKCSFLVGNPLDGWHGYLLNSANSGVVIRYSSDGKQYQVGTYTC